MRETTREIKMEVAVNYILGLSYRDIQEATGVSYGTVANTVKDLETGRLDVPGVPFDIVGDLKDLSVDLDKKGLTTSQARLGLALYDRLTNCGIKPEHVDHWFELMKEFDKPDYEVGEFFKAAHRLHELEKAEGKPFENLAGEYEELHEKIGTEMVEFEVLEKQRGEVSGEVKDVLQQLEEGEKRKKKIDTDIEISSSRSKELQSRIKNSERELSTLNTEIGKQRRKKRGLAAQTDGREQLLANLRDIGFDEEELLRLKNVLESMAKKKGKKLEAIRDEFFAMVGTYSDTSTLTKRKEEESQKLQEIIGKKSVVGGQVSELRQEKATLEGQIKQVVSSTIKDIESAGAKLKLLLDGQIATYRESLASLMSDLLRAGEAFGEMIAEVGLGNEAKQELEAFIADVKERVNG